MISRGIKYIALLTISLALIGFSLTGRSARAEAAPVKDCASCHPESYAGWHQGAHGDLQAGIVKQEEMNCTACHKNFPLVNDQASTDTGPAFKESWQRDGQPPLCLVCHATGFDPSTGTYKAEGIACEACHGEMLADHPAQKMPVNETTDLCRTCHTESRFNWDSWNTSIHFQSDMQCTTCHDPHTTKLKVVGVTPADSSVLCMNCHKSQSQDARHSIHAGAGVSCVDCHLGARKGKDDFHQVPDHSFKPALETCNGCHASQMHSIGAALRPADPAGRVVPATEPVAPIAVATPERTTTTPAPVSFVGFGGLAGFIGLLGGVIVRNISRKR